MISLLLAHLFFKMSIRILFDIMNIQIRGFEKRYKDAFIQLKDMDLNGKVVVVKGENGSGKSTLLKAISGLIIYRGTIVNELSISYMSELITLPKGTVLHEFISMMIKMSNVDLVTFNKMLEQFKLNDKLESDVSELSKGMTMKVNLLTTLMLDRDVYILDEPLSGLDNESTKFLIEYIKQSNKSFLISTHLNHEFVDIANREYEL